MRGWLGCAAADCSCCCNAQGQLLVSITGGWTAQAHTEGTHWLPKGSCCPAAVATHALPTVLQGMCLGSANASSPCWLWCTRLHTCPSHWCDLLCVPLPLPGASQCMCTAQHSVRACRARASRMIHRAFVSGAWRLHCLARSCLAADCLHVYLHTCWLLVCGAWRHCSTAASYECRRRVLCSASRPCAFFVRMEGASGLPVGEC
ncbi:hypothetical protein COO60DRAFT_1480625 [Scenedesmus sp. NREL 46B-D3]|nr:hypothetical protein COO60DRAFT_1480625 [Scenedesmus sp. NREL 46B-D3]